MSDVHILMVEDDPAIATTLEISLACEGWQTSWASTVSGAERLLEQQSFALILLDVGLPDGDGLALCSKIRHGMMMTTPIMFLTARADEVDKIVGLEVGADDYLAKPFSPRELVARIKAMLRRQQMDKASKTLQNSSQDDASFCKTIAHHRWQYHADSFSLAVDGAAVVLSKTELYVMLALLSAPNKIFSRDELLNHISDHPAHRTHRSIDAHIKALRAKLALVCADELIFTHRGLGYSVGVLSA